MEPTKTYPSQEGWYWVGGPDMGFWEIKELVHCEEGFDTYPPGYYFLTDDFPVKLKSSFDWSFVGPIPEPSLSKT